MCWVIPREYKALLIMGQSNSTPTPVTNTASTKP
uniref:Uncharacterized protein n=1 Tax=Acrobeloides nanus TaxID=290746 RepID=A0A914CSM7_9BILA